MEEETEQQREDDFVVSVDEDGVACRRPDGHIESVAWADLEAVTVEATAAAPPAPAMLWVLWGLERKSGCVYPGRAMGSDEVLDALKQRLEGFDHRSLVQALNTDEHQTFLIWQAPEERKGE